MFGRWLVIAAIGATTTTAHAQIVNVQGALAAAPDHDDTIGQAELKVNWREGNNPLFDVGGAATLLLRRDQLLFLALARGEYGTSRGLTLTRKSFEHLRTRIELDDHWRWEAFAQHEYDQFRRLSLRALAGTGPALQIINEKTLALLAGAAYVLEYEQLDVRADVMDTGRRSFAHRASLYVTGREALGAGVEVVQTVYAQPRIDAPSDVRLLAELAVQSKLTSRVALKDSLVAAYDATPTEGVKRYDTAL